MFLTYQATPSTVNESFCMVHVLLCSAACGESSCVLLRVAKVCWRKYVVLLYFLLPVVLSVLVGVGRGKEVVNLWK
jgi:hypothetical protein